MRLATEEDAEEIAALEAIVFPGNCFNETTISNELNHGVCWLGYSKEENTLLGYLLARKDGDLLDILRLGVHPDYRNTGLGTALLETAMKESEAVMLTVKKENRDALRLYTRHGFKIVGTLAEGGWVMSRR